VGVGATGAGVGSGTGSSIGFPIRGGLIASVGLHVVQLQY
jgi:hypothetical protein